MEKPGNMIMVIFGASGDLTYRKLVPAIYALYNQQMLPDQFQVVGVGRTFLTDEIFREKMVGGIREFSENNHLNEQQIFEFISHLTYFQMDQNAGEEYLRLKDMLHQMDEKEGTGSNYLFYLSLLPSMFGVIAGHLSQAGLSHSSDGYRRLIVEKPFGYDLESGLALNRQLHEAFDESQIYRIDHYLGKETVQKPAGHAIFKRYF